VNVVQAEIRGESGTGFEKGASKGPFECGNCRYFDGDSCGQKTMMARSKQPNLASGRILVDSDDCCEYVDRMGRKGGKLTAASRK
jgi:hypothetical protein